MIRAWTVLRGALLVAGLGLLAVGAWQLAGQRPRDLVGVAVWLAGGVLLHDVLLAPLVLALTWLAVRVLPPWTRGPVAAAGVVLGTVTLVAVPVLGRFGARPDNPTLLDRPYWTGWLVLAGLVWSCAGAWLGARALARHREGR